MATTTKIDAAMRMTLREIIEALGWDDPYRYNDRKLIFSPRQKATLDRLMRPTETGPYED